MWSIRELWTWSIREVIATTRMWQKIAEWLWTWRVGWLSAKVSWNDSPFSSNNTEHGGGFSPVEVHQRLHRVKQFWLPRSLLSAQWTISPHCVLVWNPYFCPHYQPTTSRRIGFLTSSAHPPHPPSLGIALSKNGEDRFSTVEAWFVPSKWKHPLVYCTTRGSLQWFVRYPHPNYYPAFF